MKMRKIKDKCSYYKRMLKDFDQYGGHAEFGRGMMRLALFKPSDFVKKLRWKMMSANGVDKLILKFPTFEITVDTRDEGIAADLTIDRMHEPVGTEILVSILRENMTIVDIGANIGYFVMQEASRQKYKQILAIEPNPASFSLLQQNIERNHFENIRALHLAISDTEGSRPFYISKQSNLCSMTPRKDCTDTIDVNVMPLDQLLAKEKVSHIDLIRMDLEGHEICVLRGMLETLKRDRPWICLEYHAPVISQQDREYFISTLESLDYELKCFTFRWSDYPIFGHTLIDRSTVIHEGQLRDVLTQITNHVLLLYIAPKETPFLKPTL